MQLLDALEWCLDLGISCVSVYAFSIDNFKRPPQEVAMLMQLAEEKLEELMQVMMCPCVDSMALCDQLTSSHSTRLCAISSEI